MYIRSLCSGWGFSESRKEAAYQRRNPIDVKWKLAFVSPPFQTSHMSFLRLASDQEFVTDENVSAEDREWIWLRYLDCNV